MRDAENGEAFLGEVEWSYGFTTRLLSGDEEARADAAAASRRTRVAAGTLVVDIGGGSTELDRSATSGRASTSARVRLTERFLTERRGDELEAAAPRTSARRSPTSSRPQASASRAR